MREITCIVCPQGCRLLVDGVEDNGIHPEIDPKSLKVSGNSCPRGDAYGRSEVVAPTRMVTATVEVEDSQVHRCPVKTSKPIHKAEMNEVVKALQKVKLHLPIKLHEVVVQNICDTGADVITTRSWQ